MDWNHNVGADLTHELNSLFSIHRDLKRASWKMECCITQVKERSSDMPFVPNFFQLVNVDGISGEVNRVGFSGGMGTKGIRL
jgi:hypothetical protein